MEKHVSPFLDQDTIRYNVAHAPFRSKLDMSEVYEQIHMRLEDIPKMAFMTIFGTFVSLVMQQGDCNVPSTFQRLMTVVFREYITQFVHVYLDDIFIFSSGCAKLSFTSVETKSVYTHREWIVLAISYWTEAYTPTPIRCRKYGTGDSPIIITTSSNS